MSKRKERRSREALFAGVTAIAQRATAAGHGDVAVSDDVLASSEILSRVLVAAHGAKRKLTAMKKFRFQLLHRWMQAHIAPCRVADIGGGKGLMAYLLNQSGWQATVIDPVAQTLPLKYKDLQTDRQIRIDAGETVPRHNSVFAPEMAQDFDLLVALHAHGCNIQILDAAAQFGRDCLLLPCCILDEPLRPPPGTHWLPCVADYARQKGFVLEPFRLNFKGQNIGLYARPEGRMR